MNTAAVLLAEGQELPPQPLLAAVFEQQAGFPRPGALRLANRARWIVWENAPADAAQVVARGLCAAGVQALAVPQSAVTPAIAPRRVHVLKLNAAWLGVQIRYTGSPEPVPWNQVAVISAGAIRSEVKTSETVEVDLGRMGKVVETRTKVDISRSIVADVYATTAAGQPLYVRLNSQEVNYVQTIGAGAQESWRDKFSLLLARLGLMATTARVTPQTEALLASGMLPEAASTNVYFNDEDELSLYTRWHATQAHLRASRQS